ncbi:hypothetical protein GCM10011591_31600 [Nocardia camponoti]|uniref:Uncharacterized protein n=1 Tax=Nocardia camponoti TaxID=1616106 RepID=A0A917QM30_9NOCA|nr:hypothetical protein GCM10011591_31600 [Nocardia camponoti]
MLRVPDAANLLEAIRIGAVSPLTIDYDPRFAHAKGQAGGGFSADHAVAIPGTDVNGRDFNTVFPGLIAGWASYSSRREELNAGRQFNALTMRFDSPERARATSDELTKRSQGDPVQIAGYPDAVARQYLKSQPYRYQALRTWLVKDDMIVFAEVFDPISMPFDLAANGSIAKAHFDAQLAGLQKYTPTPVAELSKLPLDTEDLLSHTLPYADQAEYKLKTAHGEGVYPAQAALHTISKRGKLKAAFADSGVDYVSVFQSEVYRARDNAAAIRLQAALESSIPDTTEVMRTDGPPNFEGAHCYIVKPEVKSPSYSTRPTCYGSVGRYTFITNTANIGDARQQLAAQYKLLAGKG